MGRELMILTHDDDDDDVCMYVKVVENRGVGAGSGRKLHPCGE